MWKFHDLSITRILREIKVEDSRNAKSAISTHLEVLNVNFYQFLHFLKVEINQESELIVSKIAKLRIDFT